jgi:two-component system CheB/CheR fusion protein
MTRIGGSSRDDEVARLIDENEQLRISLESALDDNAMLAEDSARLRRHLSELTREMRATRTLLAEQRLVISTIEPAVARQTETEEELRVAFEELQVLTEELEAANFGLEQSNRELDARVEQRTIQLMAVDGALRASEASLRTVADLVPDLLWRTDAAGLADWFNQRWLAYTGWTTETSLGVGWLDAIHPHDYALTLTTWHRAVACGEPFEHEYRIRNAIGGYRWFLVRAEALRDAAGGILHWFAAGTDIHDQRIALDALQQSELRFRTLIEGIPQLVWRAVGIGRWTWSSPQWRGYTGQSEAQARGLGWLDAFHPDDRAAAIESWRRAQDTGSLEIAGRIFHHAEDRYRHFRTRALPVLDGSHRVIEWLGTSTDVDDILQLQEEQGVLVAELQHRTRNLMAVVRAVTGRTLRSAASLDQFAARIEDRFSALTRVQGLLSRRDTGIRVAFDLLVREELSAHVDLAAQIAAGKVTLEGPAGVPLRSATVQIFALALHELATNAVKYGALSDRGGRLTVAWAMRQDTAPEPQLHVEWRETGVADMPPPDAPAQGGGYGRELIERALPYQLGARTHFAFEPDGVQCTIEVAVPDHHESEAIAAA